MKKYFLCFLLTVSVFVVSSCNQNNNKQVSSSENNTPTPVQDQSTPRSKITKKLTVRAEVFHFIDNLDGTGTYKDAHRKENIVIDVYDNGEMYLSKGLLSVVRYSKLSGYEYECNIHNDIWAFNYDDAINIEPINNY